MLSLKYRNMILESIKEYLNIHNWNEMFNMFWEIHDTDLIQHFLYIPLNIQIEISSVF